MLDLSPNRRYDVIKLNNFEDKSMKVLTAMQAQQYLRAEVPAKLQELIKNYLVSNPETKTASLNEVYQYAATTKLFFDIVNVAIMMFRVANGESKFDDSIIVCINEDFDFSNAQIFA
jgi:hypothetical protein